MAEYVNPSDKSPQQYAAKLREEFVKEAMPLCSPEKIMDGWRLFKDYVDLASRQKHAYAVAALDALYDAADELFARSD